MLQPLPLPAIEQLARGLEPVQVSAGQVVFRQGDQADRYYVIESGAAEVIGDGRLVTTLGPGDGFGEVALLRKVPRTATVGRPPASPCTPDVRPLPAGRHGFPAERQPGRDLG